MVDTNTKTETDRRRDKRYRLDDTVQVLDVDRDSVLGSIADLHAGGFLLVSSGADIETERTYSIKLLLPRHINGCSEVAVKAECLWVGEPMAECQGLVWAGFHIFEDSLRSLISIEEVVTEFGIEAR